VRDVGGGAVDPHAEDPAADEEAGADLGPDGRAEQNIEELAGNRHAREDRAGYEKELHDYMAHTLEEPGSLRKRVEVVKSATRSMSRRSVNYRAATCGSW